MEGLAKGEIVQKEILLNDNPTHQTPDRKFSTEEIVVNFLARPGDVNEFSMSTTIDISLRHIARSVSCNRFKLSSW